MVSLSDLVLTCYTWLQKKPKNRCCPSSLWLSNYYAGNLQGPGFDSWIISKLFDFPFCFLYAFWNALTKMSKNVFKKASSRVRECNHNSCVRNNVLLFSLHKFHYAWVFLFFLYVKHVLRALILLSLQHCSHANVWMFLTLLCVSLHCPNQLLLVVFIPFEIFCEIACQPLTDWQETKIGHPLIMWSPPPPSKITN